MTPCTVIQKQSDPEKCKISVHGLMECRGKRWGKRMTSIRHDAFRNGTRTMVQAFAIERTSGKEKKKERAMAWEHIVLQMWNLFVAFSQMHAVSGTFAFVHCGWWDTWVRRDAFKELARVTVDWFLIPDFDTKLLRNACWGEQMSLRTSVAAGHWDPRRSLEG